MYREKKAVFHHKEKGKSSATRVVWQTRMCYGKSHGDLGGEARCLLDIRGALMSTTPCACFGSHACLAGVFTKHRAMGRRQACGMLRLRRVRRQACSRTRAGEVRNADCSAPLGTATASRSSRPGVLSSWEWRSLRNWGKRRVFSTYQEKTYLHQHAPAPMHWKKIKYIHI